MTDVTILIPTFRHAAVLPYAIDSALDQEGASIELFVVGDGVEDATREVMARYEGDERIRFFDLPKGPRLGEAHRHPLMPQASGRIVTYLSDDDILLRDHAATMVELLQEADFAHPPSARFRADGSLLFFPWDYSRAEFRDVARGRRGSIGLTGVAHTMEAYRRLPHGWRTTPEGMPTDHWMWLQFMELPSIRVVRGERLTYLTFPDPVFGELPDAERAEQLAGWFRRSRESGFADELAGMLRAGVRLAAEDYHLWARREQLAVEEIRATRTWRLRDRLVRSSPVRAIFPRQTPP